ncbi:MAG TPA: S24/S26 family peptidase [Candidatus Dormibacteraeota bacterium]|nr:S24/S26 family peptidase [Candidatus Dormibacteraeota bacterium]
MKWAVRVTGVLLAAAMVAWVGWYLAGGSMQIVSSPSMSPKEPVGSLLLVRPVPSGLRDGQIVVFEPPGGGTLFAHEIVQVLPGGRYTTRGLLNATDDPWTLNRSNLRGLVVAIWPAVGRVVQAAWIWALCVILYCCLMLWIPRARGWLAPLLVAAGVLLPIFIYHPLVSAQVITEISHRGIAHVYLVSTGVLPIWLMSSTKVWLAPGHTAVLQVPVQSGSQVIRLPMTVALNSLGWMIVVLVSAAPFLIASWRAYPLGDLRPLGAYLGAVRSAVAAQSDLLIRWNPISHFGAFRSSRAGARDRRER